MPGTSTATNPRGWRIVFDEASHRYTTDVDCSNQIRELAAQHNLSAEDAERLIKKSSPIVYTSGTTFIHKFFPAFDADGAIATRMANKRGVSVEQIRFEWKQNAANACELGTRVHETCEDILNNRVDEDGQYDFRNIPRNDKERHLFAAGFTAASKVKETMKIVGVEKIVFDIDVRIAGTIDLLTMDSTGTVWILDWKTNKTIDMHNTFPTCNRGLRPIEHLENCNFVQYSLQLNLYQYLLMKAGYYPFGTQFRRGIFHLTESGPKFYEMPDLQNEIKDMLIEHLGNPPF